MKLVAPLFVILVLGSAAAACKKDEPGKGTTKSEDKSKKGDDDDDDKTSKKKGKSKSKGDDDDDDKGKPTTKDAIAFTCTDSPTSKADQLGDKKSFTAACPKHCTSGTVYGTWTYTADSSVCTAAVFAGAITTEDGGPVEVKLTKGLDAYRGTTKHGIATQDWGPYPKSFTLPSHDGDGADENSKTSCNASPSAMNKDVGDKFTVTCPACPTGGGIYGTGTYTFDSSICMAAIHSGVIKASDGGPVKVKCVKGLSSYKGSSANGVQSNEWAAYDKSFTVE